MERVSDGITESAPARKLGVSRASLSYQPKLPEKDWMLKQQSEQEAGLEGYEEVWNQALPEKAEKAQKEAGWGQGSCAVPEPACDPAIP